MERLFGPRLPACGLGDALRPFVNREIGADTVAGTMRIIDPVGPQILPRQNVELAAARPLGEARHRERDMAFEHLREAAAHFGGRRADRDRACDVGRAVGILAARVDEIERARLDRAVGRLVDLVMRQRAVGTRGRDGVERQIPQHPAGIAKFAQFRCGAEFVEVSFGRDLLHPFEEARHRDAVADMRGAGARKLGFVLDRLGQHRGVAVALDLRARALKRGEDRRDRAVGIDRHLLA